jgi:polar amino acid transport system substrate-binding protein
LSGPAIHVLKPRWQCALSFMLLLVLPAVASAGCEKTLRWDDDPPFSMQTEDGAVVGIDVDINRTVLARLGCEAKLRKLPWARALRDLEQGRLDILSGAFRLPERELYAHFSGVYLPPSRNILFMHVEAFERFPIESLLDLQHSAFRLGAKINVSYGVDYQQLMADPAFAERVVMQSKISSLLQMIGKGRIDGLIASEHTAAYEIRQLGLDKLIKPTEIVVSTDAAEVAFSKRTVDLDFVQAYAREMQVLKEDGTYEQVMRRYLEP